MNHHTMDNILDLYKMKTTKLLDLSILFVILGKFVKNKRKQKVQNQEEKSTEPTEPLQSIGYTR